MCALKAGHWPGGCDRDLRTHVETCAGCRDMVLVTMTFQQARAEALGNLQTVSPELLWWRAQLRRRNAAAERISQPLTIAQIFAWLVSLLVAAAFLASQYRHGLRWASWWSEVADSRTFHSWLLASVGLERNILLLVAALGTLAVLSGVALYLAAERE